MGKYGAPPQFLPCYDRSTAHLCRYGISCAHLPCYSLLPTLSPDESTTSLLSASSQPSNAAGTPLIQVGACPNLRQSLARLVAFPHAYPVWCLLELGQTVPGGFALRMIARPFREPFVQGGVVRFVRAASQAIQTTTRGT